MINIYLLKQTAHRQYQMYFFIDLDKHLWSSDFDYLEQLVDVNYSDPEIRQLEPNDDINSILQYPDVQLLCTVPSLDNLDETHPELFI